MLEKIRQPKFYVAILLACLVFLIRAVYVSFSRGEMQWEQVFAPLLLSVALLVSWRYYGKKKEEIQNS